MEQVKQIGTYLSQLYKVGWGLRGSLLGKGTFLLTQHLQAGQLVYVDNGKSKFTRITFLKFPQLFKTLTMLENVAVGYSEA